MIKEYISFFLFAFTSFFTIMNPLGVVPIFNSMTEGLDKNQTKLIGKKTVIVSFITLIIFAFTGQFIFRFFNISTASLKVVGGVIFFIMGQDMLKARIIKEDKRMENVAKYAKDIAVTPLAIPMLTGPGSITNAIVLMANNPSYINKSLVILSIFAVCIAAYVTLIYAQRIFKFLGETGNAVLMRLMGLIIMVIAVELMYSGATVLLRTIFMIG